MRFFNTLITSVLFFGLLITASCSFKQQQLLFKQSNPNQGNTQSNQDNSGAGTSDYRIHSQDILQIRNLQSTKYIVDEAPVSITAGGSSSTSQGQTFQVEDD